jgi:hypothetical protein
MSSLYNFNISSLFKATTMSTQIESSNTKSHSVDRTPSKVEFEFTDKLRRTIYMTWILEAHESYVWTKDIHFKRKRDYYKKQYRDIRLVKKSVKKI